MEFEDGSYEIIGCAMHVHKVPGPGLREKPYENTLCVAFRNKNLQHKQQPSFPIYYEDIVVGECIPDMMVEDIVVDTKSIDQIGDSEISQMLNYLRISGRSTGLIINFRNTKLEWKRVVR